MDWFLDRQDRASASLLRREITGYLGRHAVDQAEQIDDAALIVAELLANAYDHGRGDIWVSLQWTEVRPVLEVHDMGEAFTLPREAPTAEQYRGRGLWLVSQFSSELAVAAKRAGGKFVRSVLPVVRPVELTLDLPARRVSPLPAMSEARPEGGFGRESFLRALVVQLSTAVEQQQGPEAAQRAIAQVAADIGGQMEQEYRDAIATQAAQLAPEQIAECLVRLKAAIGGTFHAVEITGDRLVFVNSDCPFGAAVRQSPSLCRMTSSVFGGIAARNVGESAVTLEERIAVGDPQCRVVVHLGAAAAKAENAHRYTASA
ncbi:methanogen output domain 1-containing protein [Amycolatopsis sp. WQ 127309]|uniref:methanogen output domain 1-containing protein n=1 Tax=Amycolatopsis sp. WQ 127309 TaxID=2932773 RepID=UPI001FF3E624|nr:methanogen output domain 1-containing protein [Amycolatopsis sp. WQ 127309]UOZ07117.1 methanogen output domain 1-containing protein [Amycolatopsis sp. WQ 127309]